jgi:hypothetical protein
MVTSELSVVAHVSNAVPPGATFIGLAPTKNREVVSAGTVVAPTTTEAFAVFPVVEVTVAVYKVVVVGLTTALPGVVVCSGTPPASTATVPFDAVQLSGA